VYSFSYELSDVGIGFNVLSDEILDTRGFLIYEVGGNNYTLPLWDKTGDLSQTELGATSPGLLYMHDGGRSISEY